MFLSRCGKMKIWIRAQAEKGKGCVNITVMRAYAAPVIRICSVHFVYMCFLVLLFFLMIVVTALFLFGHTIK